jgi:hypothetical protein
MGVCARRQRVTILAWDAAQTGLLAGLADFSVVYLQHAGAMVRRIVVGSCARKGLSLPALGPAGAASGARLLESSGSLGSSWNLFSSKGSLGSSAPAASTPRGGVSAAAAAAAANSLRAAADGAHRDRFRRSRSGDGASGRGLDAAAGRTAVDNSSHGHPVKKRSVPIVLPTFTRSAEAMASARAAQGHEAVGAGTRSPAGWAALPQPLGDAALRDLQTVVSSHSRWYCCVSPRLFGWRG